MEANGREGDVLQQASDTVVVAVVAAVGERSHGEDAYQRNIDDTGGPQIMERRHGSLKHDTESTAQDGSVVALESQENCYQIRVQTQRPPSDRRINGGVDTEGRKEVGDGSRRRSSCSRSKRGEGTHDVERGDKLTSSSSSSNNREVVQSPPLISRRKSSGAIAEPNVGMHTTVSHVE